MTSSNDDIELIFRKDQISIKYIELYCSINNYGFPDKIQIKSRKINRNQKLGLETIRLGNRRVIFDHVK